jgi:F-type H+-transporting ATPase subunit epsilon
MAKLFLFELVSPEKLVFSGEIEQVDIPGSEGDFGVLAEHSPLISTVKPGVIRIHQGGRIAQRIFVTGGFAEVTLDRCTMLADAATLVNEIDAAAAQAELLRMNNEPVSAADEQQKAAMVRRLDVARAKVAAAAEAGR